VKTKKRIIDKRFFRRQISHLGYSLLIGIFISRKATFIRTFKGRDYGIDFSLDQLATLLNPFYFCRMNMKYIVALSAITGIIAYSGSHLKLKLSVPVDEDILVSREMVQEFKAWLDR
jgi:DNA-binding LytR/AlgR family response regulator